jgi:diacylglycerol kinase (ATP)
MQLGRRSECNSRVQKGLVDRRGTPSTPKPVSTVGMLGWLPMAAPTAPPPYRRALVIANPIAGRGRARLAAEGLSSELRRIGIANALHFTGGRGDARRRVQEIGPEVDLVVCVGGDGTLGEVLAGLGDRDVPVALLPAGTANVLSLDLHLPREVEGVVDAISGGKTIRIDTARVNGERLSFLVTSVGFDAMIVHEVEARRRGPISKSTYLAAGLRVLERYRPPHLAVEVDGRPLEGRYAQVIVSNVVHYGGFRVLAGDRELDDGLYEVYLFRKGSRASLFACALRALVRGLPGGTCTRVRARRVRITSETPVPCQVDGDAFGETPVEIGVHLVQSRLVVP